MMKKNILLQFIAAIFLSCIALIHTGGPMATPAVFASSEGRGEDLNQEMRELVALEKQTVTTAENVRERFKRLTDIVSSLLRSGQPVRHILSRDKGDTISRLLRDQKFEEAAEMVHEAIMLLDNSNGGPPHETHSLPQEGFSDNNGKPRISSAGSDGPVSPKELVSSVPLFQVNIHQLATGQRYGNLLKLTNPALDTEGRRLYLCGTKSTNIGVIDMDTDRIIETIDLGREIPCGYLLFDRKSGLLYSHEIGEGSRIVAIDLREKKVAVVSSLPSSLALPKREGEKRGATRKYRGLKYTDTGYPFEVGYLQNENAAYGVIEVRNAEGRELGRILHGPDALYFDIDEKAGKLYTTNTGDGSVSVFDLNNHDKKIKDIDVGTSVDEVVLNQSTGGIYIRNRLGGSTIFSYNPDSHEFKTIPNENTAGSGWLGMWPTQMIYDDGRLYVLSHYRGWIDVVDSATNSVTGHIPLNLSYKPRTDGISAMAMNTRRKILYAAFPEMGEVAIADAGTMKPVKTLRMEGYDKSRIGPSRIALTVDEKLDRLFVYLSEEKVLCVYDGPGYTLQKKISVSAGRIDKISLANPEKGVLYLGNKVLDAETLTVIGAFSRGRRVIAFDNKQDRVYLSDEIPVGPGKIVEKVYEFEGMDLKKEWTMAPILSIPSSFAFDFRKNRFYAGYFEASVVAAFDLSAGAVPSGSPLPPVGDRERERGLGPKKPGKGRCGDGICQPVEKEKGVCPEDCK